MEAQTHLAVSSGGRGHYFRAGAAQSHEESPWRFLLDSLKLQSPAVDPDTQSISVECLLDSSTTQISACCA